MADDNVGGSYPVVDLTRDNEEENQRLPALIGVARSWTGDSIRTDVLDGGQQDASSGLQPLYSFIEGLFPPLQIRAEVFQPSPAVASPAGPFRGARTPAPAGYPYPERAHQQTVNACLDTRGGRANVCQTCYKAFSSRAAYNRHKAAHNYPYWPVECSVCHRRFRKVAHFRVHSWTHSRGKSHRCPYCYKCYTQSYNLTRHLRTHGEPLPGSSADRQTYAPVGTALGLQGVEVSGHGTNAPLLQETHPLDPSLSHSTWRSQ